METNGVCEESRIKVMGHELFRKDQQDVFQVLNRTLTPSRGTHHQGKGKWPHLRCRKKVSC
jgi:hypothetical protein